MILLQQEVSQGPLYEHAQVFFVLGLESEHDRVIQQNEALQFANGAVRVLHCVDIHVLLSLLDGHPFAIVLGDLSDEGVLADEGTGL